jgi:hypothetical protein
MLIDAPISCRAETKNPQPGRWRHLTRKEASFCAPEDNMLYMTTGEANDVIVLDVDVGNGMTAYRELLDSAGIPFGSLDHTLTQSDGRHAFFSYEKSVRAGLAIEPWKANQMSNMVKMVLNGQSVSMDLRGDGGLIILPPTSITFSKTTGKTRYYQALRPIPGKGELPAMPPVLIELLNSQAPAQREGTCRGARPASRVARGAGVALGVEGEMARPIPGAEGELSASVVARLDAILSRRGSRSFVYYKRERMESGEWRFEYKPQGGWVCGHDVAHSGSNSVSFYYDPQTDRFTERCHGGVCDRRARTSWRRILRWRASSWGSVASGPSLGRTRASTSGFRSHWRGTCGCLRMAGRASSELSTLGIRASSGWREAPAGAVPASTS